MRARWWTIAALGLALTTTATACTYEQSPRTAAQYESMSAGLPPPPQRAGDTEQQPAPPWPRYFRSGDTTAFAIYEPYLDTWNDGSAVQAQLPVEVSTMADTSADPKYGLVWISAVARNDASRRLVTLDQIHLVRASFPTAKEREVEYLKMLRGADVIEARPLTLTEEQLAASRARKAELDAGFQPTNDVATRQAPTIVFVEGSATTPSTSESNATPGASTKIVTQGPAVWEQISGTTLSYLKNTDADVFYEIVSGKVYVLLSGLWFRSSSLKGPWTYVPARDVPSTFSSIPKEHREARVLASIPNTPQAEEARIAGMIPEMATVDRSKALLAVAYEGDPDFAPVEGTSAPLRYALNSSTPVFAAEGMYYAIEDGVWFVSSSPTGPWSVATSVPSVIYSIPQSSPLHYVTYVRIYDYSPRYVFVGCTPGYLGAVYTDGVVAWGPAVGIGFGVGLGPRYLHHHVYRGGTWRPGWSWRAPSQRPVTVYQRWSPGVVRARAPFSSPRATTTVPSRAAPPAPPHVIAQPRVSAPSTSAPTHVPRTSIPPSQLRTTPSAPTYVPRTPPPSQQRTTPSAPTYVPRPSIPPSQMSRPPASSPPTPGYVPRVVSPSQAAPRVAPPARGGHRRR